MTFLVGAVFEIFNLYFYLYKVGQTLPDVCLYAIFNVFEHTCYNYFFQFIVLKSIFASICVFVSVQSVPSTTDLEALDSAEESVILCVLFS